MRFQVLPLSGKSSLPQRVENENDLGCCNLKMVRNIRKGTLSFLDNIKKTYFQIDFIFDMNY